jgi:hypothetical protein
MPETTSPEHGAGVSAKVSGPVMLPEAIARVHREPRVGERAREARQAGELVALRGHPAAAGSPRAAGIGMTPSPPRSMNALPWKTLGSPVRGLGRASTCIGVTWSRGMFMSTTIPSMTLTRGCAEHAAGDAHHVGLKPPRGRVLDARERVHRERRRRA